MDLKKVDSILMNASVEDLVAVANIARSARSGLVKVEGDHIGTYSKWSIVPQYAPEWLWKESRNLDSWALSFVSECLSLLSSDVRITPGGKPFTNLLFYQNAGYRDNEVLIKWANSTPERSDVVAEAMKTERNMIGAARLAYEAERLNIFAMVFENVYKQYQKGDVPVTEIEMEDIDASVKDSEEYDD